MNDDTMVKDENAAKKASDDTDMAPDNTNNEIYVLGSGMGWQAISPVRPDSKSPDSESEEDEFLASCTRGDHKKFRTVKDTVYVPGPQSSGCDQPKCDLQAKVAALQAKVDLKRKRG